jgi:hypothetical protein
VTERIAELQDIYQDLALALGAAHGDAEVEERVARLWTLAVLGLADEDSDPTGLPATVEPADDPPADFDVEGCLAHVAAAVEPTALLPGDDLPAGFDVEGRLAHVAATVEPTALLPGGDPLAGFDVEGRPAHLTAAVEPTTPLPSGDPPGRLDVEGSPAHVAAAVEPATPPLGGDRWPTVRTAALLWVAAATVFGVVLGSTFSGPVALPAFLPPVATGLLAAFAGAGRAPGALWAVGLAPLAFLLPGATSWLAVLAFVLLVAGFGYVLWLADPWARRRPLELGLVLCGLAALTAPTDVVAIVFVCWAGALLWRRRWTALVAAGVCGFTALGPSILYTAPGGGVPPDVLTYLVLTAGWGWAAFDRAWLASRLPLVERILRLVGLGARSAYRTTQRYADGVVATPGRAPARQEAEMRYCWTCHQRKPHIAPGTSPAICTDCLGRAGQLRGEALRRQWCDRCARHQPFTHRGCLRCWETGARS